MPVDGSADPQGPGWGGRFGEETASYGARVAPENDGGRSGDRSPTLPDFMAVLPRVLVAVVETRAGLRPSIRKGEGEEDRRGLGSPPSFSLDVTYPRQVPL